MRLKARMPHPHQVLYSSVLIVENDEFSASLVEYLLHREGYQVATAYSDRHIRRLFDIMLPPDLIFIHSKLIYTDTHDLIAKMRDHERWKHLPIILIGDEKDSTVDEILETGADDFILKPYFPNELIRQVKTHAKRTH